jgi:Flp pilus assembly pilin Flp
MSAQDDAAVERSAFVNYDPNLLNQYQIQIPLRVALGGPLDCHSARGVNSMKSKILVKLWNDERGQDLTEYVLLVALLALAAIASMSNLSSAISTTFSSAAVHLSASI